MNKIVEFLVSNYLLVLVVIVIVFGIYIIIIKKRNRYFETSENEITKDLEKENSEKDLPNNEIGKSEKTGFTIPQNTTCNSKKDLIELFEKWLDTDENTIGDIDNYPKNTKWIFFNLNGNGYYINADTRREGVQNFVNNHYNGFTWKVILNTKRVFKKVTNHPAGFAMQYLYFYANEIGQREI